MIFEENKDVYKLKIGEMNKIKYSLSIILICFAFVSPAVNARGFSETENESNATKSFEKNMTAMRSYDPYACSNYWGKCEACVLQSPCFYCAESERCTSSPFDDCGNEKLIAAICPSDNTALYIGVTIGCLQLLILGILVYCIIKRRRAVNRGMIIGQQNPPFRSPGESVMQVPQRNQDLSSPAETHSTTKFNSDQTSY